MSVFKEFIGNKTAESIIRMRVSQLAEEGYQHELNIGFIKDQLTSEEDEAVRESLLRQLEESQNRTGDLAAAISWHMKKLEALDGNSDT